MDYQDSSFDICCTVLLHLSMHYSFGTLASPAVTRGVCVNTITVAAILEAKVRSTTFLGNSAPGHRSSGERREPMRVKRVKYKRTTPKTQTVFTKVDFDLGGGFDRLLKTVARVIEKYFGLLYVHRSCNVFR